MSKKKKIYILLQQFDGLFGDLYSFIENSKYNHASIGLSDSMNEFFSFRTKWGFCIEHPFHFNKDHKKEIPCVIYEIEVNESIYLSVENEIQEFKKEKDMFHYSYLSLTLGFIGIKHKMHRGYFCSKFVAEILFRTGRIKLIKDTSVYLPSDFEKENFQLKFEGLAKDFISV